MSEPMVIHPWLAKPPTFDVSGVEIGKVIRDQSRAFAQAEAYEHELALLRLGNKWLLRILLRVMEEENTCSPDEDS